MRRLRNDRAALERLHAESSVFNFSAHGELPQNYQILLKGKSLWRDRGKIRVLEAHRIEIKLGASYPRSIPEIRWLTPIYHPNISEIGMVCLGGYGTHWVPSVQLDELCIMLWDMARFHNYDIRSPYNRDAALWVASQTKFRFPLDSRPLRDKRAAQGRVDSAQAAEPADKKATAVGGDGLATALAQVSAIAPERVRRFLDRYRATRGNNGSGPVRNGNGEDALATQFANSRAVQTEPERNDPAENHAAQAMELIHERPAANQGDVEIELDRNDADEVVLLESVTTIEPARGTANPPDDEIIYIE
jgi:ubiquitin-protein ligase